VPAKGGADSGRSNRGEENSIHKTMRQKWCLIRQRPTSRASSSPTQHKDMHLEVVKRSKPPLRHSTAPPRPARTTKLTTFRGRRPDVPPLALELQCRTNHPPVAQTTQGNRPQNTAITPTRPGPPPRRDIKPPPLRRVDRADYLVAQATEDSRPNPSKQLLHPMKLVPTMVSEAAASTHKHHLLETAVPTSTNPTTKKHKPSADVDSRR
jgi:hypothetical protein